MADGWYCQINGKVIGPLQSAQLKQQLIRAAKE